MSNSTGPAMICATAAMRPGPARIGRLGAGITLPRTVALPTLVAVAVGATVGIIAAVAVAASFNAFLYGAIFGGGAGWFLVTYSPLQGESLARWVYLKTNTARRTRRINGVRVTLAVGVAPVAKPPAGAVRLLRSSVRVPSEQYDERGVLISEANRNIPQDATAATRASLSGSGRVQNMTAGGGSELRGRRPGRRERKESRDA